MKTINQKARFTVLFVASTLFMQMPSNPSMASISKRAPQKKLAQYSEIMNSDESKVVSKKYLKETVLQKVTSSLPKKFKSQASVVAREVLAQSERYHMDPLFLLAVIQTESSFNPDSVGPVGELGLMQLRVSTGEWIAKKYKLPFQGEKDLKSPVKNIRLGAAYLDYLRKKFDGSAESYISAYNMGPTNVLRLAQEQIVPQIYSTKVIRHYVSIHDLLAKRVAQSERAQQSLAQNKMAQDLDIIEL